MSQYSFSEFFRTFALRFFFFAFLFAGQTAWALDKLGPPVAPGGGTAYSFARLVIGIIIKMAIPVLVAVIVVFAFQIVAAQGDEKTLAEAKHRFKIALITTVVFLGLGLIATIIYNTGGSIGYFRMFP